MKRISSLSLDPIPVRASPGLAPGFPILGICRVVWFPPCAISRAMSCISRTAAIGLPALRMTRTKEERSESIRLRSHEVAKAMEQISGNTKDNYKAIEHVTAATQENSAGMEEIEQMVTKVRKLAQELHEIRTDR